MSDLARYQHQVSCRERTMTFDLGVSPEQLFTLAARPPPKAWLTGTLTADLWTQPTTTRFNGLLKNLLEISGASRRWGLLTSLQDGPYECLESQSQV